MKTWYIQRKIWYQKLHFQENILRYRVMFKKIIEGDNNSCVKLFFEVRWLSAWGGGASKENVSKVSARRSAKIGLFSVSCYVNDALVKWVWGPNSDIFQTTVIFIFKFLHLSHWSPGLRLRHNLNAHMPQVLFWWRPLHAGRVLLLVPTCSPRARPVRPSVVRL